MHTYTLSEKFDGLRGSIITENLDEDDLRDAARIFDRIDSIMGEVDVPAIDEPLDQAREELAKMLSGREGVGEKAWSLLTGKKQRILSKIMDTQIQIVSLFRNLPRAMSLSGKNLAKRMSGVEYSRENDPNRIDTPDIVAKSVREALMEVGGDAGQSIVDRMEALIKKGLTPGFLKKPVINPDEATNQLLDLQLNEFMALIKRIGGQELKVPITPEEIEKIQASKEEADERTPKYLAMLRKRDQNAAKVAQQIRDRLDQNLINSFDDFVKKYVATPKLGNPAPVVNR